MKTRTSPLGFTAALTVASLAFVAFLGVSCETMPSPPREGWVEMRGQTFCLWLPPKFEARRLPRANSNIYCLYEPLLDDHKPATLNIFEGLEPMRFFSEAKEKRERLGLVQERSGKVSIGQFHGVESVGRDANGKLWRELYLRRPDQITVLHIWYFEVPEEKAAQFDTILRSIGVPRR